MAEPSPSPTAPTPYAGAGPPSSALLSATPPPSHLRGLILQKEKELHDINEYRIHTLESLLSEKEREVGEGKQRLSKLKEDFTYNLKLLEERDAELYASRLSSPLSYAAWPLSIPLGLSPLLSPLSVRPPFSSHPH